MGRKEKKEDRKEKKNKKDEEDYFSGSPLEEVEPSGTDPAGIFDEMPAEVVAAVAEEMKPNDVAGIVEGMDKEAAANMFEEMVSRRMAERRGEKTKKDKKDKKNKKDEEDDFSGSGMEEPVGTDPAGIMGEMDKEVAAGVMEELKRMSGPR